MDVAQGSRPRQAGRRLHRYVHIATKQENTRKGAPHLVPLADRAMGSMKQWLLGTLHGRRTPMEGDVMRPG